MTKATAAELLDLIIDRAPKLRELGITHVELEQLSVTLAPHEPEASGEDEDDDVEPPRGGMYDPMTYGLPPGSKPPGKARKER
jgi:hypothetical protein